VKQTVNEFDFAELVLQQRPKKSIIFRATETGKRLNIVIYQNDRTCIRNMNPLDDKPVRNYKWKYDVIRRVTSSITTITYVSIFVSNIALLTYFDHFNWRKVFLLILLAKIIAAEVFSSIILGHIMQITHDVKYVHTNSIMLL
jgi:hypothetical protein